MNSKEINILFVSSANGFALSVDDNLAQASICCDYACRSKTALNLAKKEQYSVIVIDLDCQSLNGVELCRGLRGEGIDTPVLMLSDKQDIESKELAFMAGTDDYLVKPFAMKELELRTKALSARRSGQVKKLRVEDLELHIDTKQVTRNGKALKLTPTNLKLLELLMRKSPSIITRHEIEDEIWPEGAPDSDNLKVQLYQLRTRVDKAFGSSLIQTVTGQGVRIGASA